MITKVVSGGQIGADVAGLRAAHALGITTGGHAPKGWRTLYGPNPSLARYGLIEHGSSYYPPRTRENARNSDGTIRFAVDFNTAGERCTLREVQAAGRPHFDVAIAEEGGRFFCEISVQAAIRWVQQNNIRVLNVAGNGKPEIEEPVFGFMIELLKVIGMPELRIE